VLPSIFICYRLPLQLLSVLDGDKKKPKEKKQKHSFKYKHIKSIKFMFIDKLNLELSLDQKKEETGNGAHW
jgi:hypothetical protein